MRNPLYDIPLKTIDGQASSLGAYAGKVLLVVNVASQCGLTPQYAGLEKLYETYAARGFSVLGFPANDFAGQEPGSDAEIQAFCSTSYAVKFPLFGKIVATGPDKHPLYAQLTRTHAQTDGRERMETMLRGHQIEPTLPPEVVWNFEKFLIGRQGEILRRFAPDVQPDAAELIAAIETALAEA